MAIQTLENMPKFRESDIVRNVTNIEGWTPIRNFAAQSTLNYKAGSLGGLRCIVISCQNINPVPNSKSVMNITQKLNNFLTIS